MGNLEVIEIHGIPYKIGANGLVFKKIHGEWITSTMPLGRVSAKICRMKEVAARKEKVRRSRYTRSLARIDRLANTL